MDKPLSIQKFEAFCETLTEEERTEIGAILGKSIGENLAKQHEARLESMLYKTVASLFRAFSEELQRTWGSNPITVADVVDVIEIIARKNDERAETVTL